MKQHRIKSIGVFDSGFGGLSVLKELKKRLPQYDYVYLGDTARAPYGPREPEDVLQFSKEAVDFLFKEGAELIVFACNTASAEALRTIQQTYLAERYGTEKRVLGVVVPIAEYVASVGAKRVGVVATLGTVRSGAYVREIQRHAPEVLVFQNAAPLLVSLVEEGKHESEEALLRITEYVEPLLRERIDTLVLGCTHYGHLEPLFKKAAGPDVRVISGAPIVAEKLASYFERHTDIEESLSTGGGVTFYTTGELDRFESLGELFFGSPLKAVFAKL